MVFLVQNYRRKYKQSADVECDKSPILLDNWNQRLDYQKVEQYFNTLNIVFF